MDEVLKDKSPQVIGNGAGHEIGKFTMKDRNEDSDFLHDFQVGEASVLQGTEYLHVLGLTQRNGDVLHVGRGSKVC